jgi:hypothetical protein
MVNRPSDGVQQREARGLDRRGHDGRREVVGEFDEQ